MPLRELRPRQLSHRRHRRRRGRGGWSPPPPLPPRFGPENIRNAAENWFGKIFRLVIFSQIVSQWSRLAKYYFLGLFEQLHPDFEKPINSVLPFFHLTLRQPVSRSRNGGLRVCGNPVKCKAKGSDCNGKMSRRKSENKNSAYSQVWPTDLNIIWYQNTTPRMCS